MSDKTEPDPKTGTEQKTEPTAEQVKAELAAYRAIVAKVAPDFTLDAAKEHLYTNSKGELVYIPPATETKTAEAKTEAKTGTETEAKPAATGDGSAALRVLAGGLNTATTTAQSSTTERSVPSPADIMDDAKFQTYLDNELTGT